jgi:hypothetical protein
MSGSHGEDPQQVLPHSHLSSHRHSHDTCTRLAVIMLTFASPSGWCGLFGPKCSGASVSHLNWSQACSLLLTLIAWVATARWWCMQAMQQVLWHTCRQGCHNTCNTHPAWQPVMTQLPFEQVVEATCSEASTVHCSPQVPQLLESSAVWVSQPSFGPL